MLHLFFNCTVGNLRLGDMSGPYNYQLQPALPTFGGIHLGLDTIGGYAWPVQCMTAASLVNLGGIHIGSDKKGQNILQHRRGAYLGMALLACSHKLAPLC